MKSFIIVLIIIALAAFGYVYYNNRVSSSVTEQVSTVTPTQTVKAQYTNISPADAKKMIDENPSLIVVDVSPSYKEGHLPRAINYYLGDGSLDRAIPTLDKDASYLVYCRIDSAAIQGAQTFVNAGFKNVYRLEGNYSAWVGAGYPIEK